MYSEIGHHEHLNLPKDLKDQKIHRCSEFESKQQNHHCGNGKSRFLTWLVLTGISWNGLPSIEADVVYFFKFHTLAHIDSLELLLNKSNPL